MKYLIITFGCQMNESDSERISSLLEKSGHSPAKDLKGADLIVVNMCSVRQSAVDRVFGIAQTLKELKKGRRKYFRDNKYPSANFSPRPKLLKTVLTGCILQKDRKKFSEKFDEIVKFKDLLRYLPKGRKKQTANIPISNGCNNACTYCAVPFTRGRLVCRDHRDILKEIENAAKRGTKEIWLLGQNVNDYHSPADKAFDFAALLKKAATIQGKFCVRFMSPNPKNFSDELIRVMAGSEKIAKFLNLPVQSGDDQILKKMNRPYTAKQYKNLIKEIREKIPDINLTTDIIVGFPGETKAQFLNTVKLFKELKFNLAYISKYSPRPGTAAAKMKDNIPLAEKKERERILRDILDKK
jgi:tRNA-2-methylthio-N6-dimethylallyladenosine synthase